MLMALEKDLRIRLDTAAKEKIDATFARKKISQQDGVRAIMLWFADQDDLVQSVILGQVAPTTAIMEMMMERLTEQAEADALADDVVSEARDEADAQERRRSQVRGRKRSA